MPSFDFLSSLFALLSACAIVLMAYLLRNLPQPTLYFSEVEGLAELPPSIKQRLYFLPTALYSLSIFFLLLAASGPHTFQKGEQIELPGKTPERPPPPTEGIAIYFILDQSGSMEEKVSSVNSYGVRSKEQKIKLLKDLTMQFIAGDARQGIEGRKDDMIGVVTFARSAQVLSPLTLNHQALLKRLSKLDIMRIKDQDGTAIGYAIFKTANLFVSTKHFAEQLQQEGKPAYTIKSAVMILVTDGLQDINPLDKEKRFRSMSIESAAEFAAENGIRLYVINVEPGFATDQYAPQRREMTRIVKKAGGDFFQATENESLSEIYKQIDKLEKSLLPGSGGIFGGKESLAEMPSNRIDYSWVPAGFALILLSLGIILEALWLKKVP